MSSAKGACLAAILLFFTSAAQAQKCDLIDGEAAPCFEVRTWGAPNSPVAVGQRVELNIEITTNQTLVSGTQIGQFEVPDLTVLRLSDFAVNSTRSLGGQNLNVQLWTLTLFPHADGWFDIPEIPLSLKTRNSAGAVVDKNLVTQPLRFQAFVPKPAQGIENWVAAETLTVTERFDRPLEGLKPGDAVTRTVLLQADGLPGMMMPGVALGVFEGMTAYPQLPKISDNTNRGRLKGGRTEVIVYQIERHGRQVIPAQEFVWWNTTSQTLERFTLPEHSFDVRGGWFGGGSLKRTIVLLAGSALILVVLWGGGMFAAGRWRHLTSKPTLGPTAGEVKAALHRSLREGDVDNAISCLYQWIDLCAPPSYWGSVRRYLRVYGSRDIQVSFETMMRKRHEGLLQIEDVRQCATLLTASIERSKKARRDSHRQKTIQLNET